MNKSQILKSAIWRSAIKQFDPVKKISDADFDFLLEIARLSPSSYGFEPWNIVVLQNEKLRKAIRPQALGASKQLDTASHFLIFTVKTDLTANSKYFEHILRDVRKMPAVARLATKTSFRPFARFLQDLTDDRKRHDWAAKQAYIAMANIMLAAAEIGIDSCPIEGFNLAKVEKILSQNNVVDLTTDRVAVMLALGYRAGEPKHPKTRRAMDEIVKYIN
jgi:nitroreductase